MITVGQKRRVPKEMSPIEEVDKITEADSCFFQLDTKNKIGFDKKYWKAFEDSKILRGLFKKDDERKQL